MTAAEAGFVAWVAGERAKRAGRANRRAAEARAGRALDDEGRYWLERTAVLENIASVADTVARREPGLCGELRELLDRLDRVRPPVCRDGDHQ